MCAQALAMQEVLLIVAGVAVLPIAARLWRAGRLSDRAITNVMVAWAPTLAFSYGLIHGWGVVSILAISALLLAPGLALHQVIFGLIRDQDAQPR
jgi:hypothetical protein